MLTGDIVLRRHVYVAGVELIRIDLAVKLICIRFSVNHRGGVEGVARHAIARAAVFPTVV